MVHSVKLLETNYSYIIEDSSRALIVDPGEAEPIINIIRKLGLIPSVILLTHRHLDHTGGVNEIREMFPGISIIDNNWDSLLTFNDQNIIDIIKTPGHTSDSCSFYLPKRGILFTGDTLFTGICGRVINGTLEDLHSSLQKISRLPDTTRIYPGHEYLKESLKFLEILGVDSHFYKSLEKMEKPSINSTVGDEIKNNPFMTPEFRRFKDLRIMKG